MADLFEKFGLSLDNDAQPTEQATTRKAPAKALDDVIQSYQQMGQGGQTGGRKPDLVERFGLDVNAPLNRAPLGLPSPQSAKPVEAGKKQYNVLGGIADVGRMLYDIPVQSQAAIGHLAEGGENPVAEMDWKDRWIAAGEQRARERDALPGGEEYVLPFIQRKDIRDAGKSTGFSAVAMGAGLGAGLGAGAAGGPVAGYGAGIAASGAAAFQMDRNMFTRQIYEALNEESLEKTGNPITPEAWAKKLAASEEAITRHGLWEAVPEAIGNAGAFAIITKPLAGILGKNVVTRLASKMGAMYGTELATETVTQTGQHNTEMDAGIAPPDAQRRSLLSPTDLAESFKEVAPQTLVLTSVMGGAGIAGNALYNRVRGEQQPPGTDQPPQDTPDTGPTRRLLGAQPGAVPGEPADNAPLPGIPQGPGNVGGGLIRNLRTHPLGHAKAPSKNNRLEPGKSVVLANDTAGNILTIVDVGRGQPKKAGAPGRVESVTVRDLTGNQQTLPPDAAKNLRIVDLGGLSDAREQARRKALEGEREKIVADVQAAPEAAPTAEQQQRLDQIEGELSAPADDEVLAAIAESATAREAADAARQTELEAAEPTTAEPGRSIVDQAVDAALATEEGRTDAEEIRGDQGQSDQGGTVEERGQADRGTDVQQGAEAGPETGRAGLSQTPEVANEPPTTEPSPPAAPTAGEPSGPGAPPVAPGAGAEGERVSNDTQEQVTDGTSSQITAQPRKYARSPEAVSEMLHTSQRKLEFVKAKIRRRRPTDRHLYQSELNNAQKEFDFWQQRFDALPEAEKANYAERQKQVRQVNVGDIVYHPIFGRIRVTKKNEKSIWAENIKLNDDLIDRRIPYEEIKIAPPVAQAEPGFLALSDGSPIRIDDPASLGNYLTSMFGSDNAPPAEHEAVPATDGGGGYFIRKRGEGEQRQPEGQVRPTESGTGSREGGAISAGETGGETGAPAGGGSAAVAGGTAQETSAAAGPRDTGEGSGGAGAVGGATLPPITRHAPDKSLVPGVRKAYRDADAATTPDARRAVADALEKKSGNWNDKGRTQAAAAALAIRESVEKPTDVSTSETSASAAETTAPTEAVEPGGREPAADRGQRDQGEDAGGASEVTAKSDRRTHPEAREAIDALPEADRKAVVSAIRNAFESSGKSERRVNQKYLEDRGIAPALAEEISNWVAGKGLDPLTGFERLDARNATVDSAIAHVAETGDKGFYVETDIRNLGGLNKKLGNSGANEVFKAFTDAYAEAMRAVDGEVSLFRHGGDEISAVIVGPKVTRAAVDAAIQTAEREVAKIAKARGLDNIPHPKHPGETAFNGTGISAAAAEISPASTRSEIISQADTAVELKKVKRDVKRGETETPGPVAPAGQARGVGESAAGEDVGGGKETGSGAQTGGKEGITAAANEAATSPENDTPEPTPAQIEAGNYKKGHVNLHGLDISIENPKGSERSGVDPNGKPWSVVMPAHYGYVRRSEGADGDQVDVYIGPNPDSTQVFVVDQKDLQTGKFDEHKVVLGTNSQAEAEKVYKGGFSDGKGAQRMQAITPMSLDEFKAWLKEGDTKRAVAETKAPASETKPSVSEVAGGSDQATFQKNLERKGVATHDDVTYKIVQSDAGGYVIEKTANGIRVTIGSPRENWSLEMARDRAVEEAFADEKSVQKETAEESTTKEESAVSGEKGSESTPKVGDHVSWERYGKTVKGIVVTPPPGYESDSRIYDIFHVKADPGSSKVGVPNGMVLKLPRSSLTVLSRPADAKTERERIATLYAKRMQEKHSGRDPSFDGTPSAFHYDFADAILKKSAKTLDFIANGLNDTAKQVFTEVTGIRLPRTQSGTREKLKQWAEGTAKKDDKPNNRTQFQKDRQVNPAEDSLTAAIAKLGGLDRAEARKQGIDTPDLKKKGWRILPIFSTTGRSFDAMAEALSEYSYPVFNAQGNYDANTLLDALDKELRGTPVYAPAGIEAAAERDAAARDQAEAEAALADDPFGIDIAPGDLLEEGEYTDEMDAEGRRLLELADIANGLEEDAGAEIIERGALQDKPNSAIIDELEAFIHARENTGRDRAGETAREQGEGAPAETPALELSGQTDEEIRAEQERLRALEAARAAADKAAADKAKADKDRDQFELTGSTAPADRFGGRQGDLVEAANSTSTAAKQEDAERHAKRELESVFAEISHHPDLQSLADAGAAQFNAKALDLIEQAIHARIGQAIEAADKPLVSRLNGLVDKTGKPEKTYFDDASLAGLQSDVLNKRRQAERQAQRTAWAARLKQARGAAAVARWPDAGDAGLAEHEAFLLAWDRAIDGRTRSQIPQDADSLAGYDAAQAWLQSDEGQRFSSGKRPQKIESTGAQLRRVRDERRQRITDLSPDDPSALVQGLFDALVRSNVFSVALAENATPGARRYLDFLRNKVRPFRTAAAEHIGGRSWRRYADSAESYLTKAIERNPENIKKIRSFAERYNQAVTALSEALDGAGSVQDLRSSIERLVAKDPRFGIVGDYSEFFNTRLDWLAFDPVVKSFQRDEDQEVVSTSKTPIRRERFDRVTREGVDDYRKGRDITPAELKETFGFADITFGDYVTAKQRQDHMNYAYDAFRDLAEFLSLETKHISLGGRLHLAFGALGSGRHSAHYSPNQPHPDGGTVQVINLTNTRGDGALAHEWFHALDWAIRRTTPPPSSQRRTPYMRHGQQSGSVRDLVALLRVRLKTAEEIENYVQRFLKGKISWNTNSYYGIGQNKRMENARYALERMRKDLHTLESRYPLAYESSQFHRNAIGLGKDYWANDNEMFARALEAYIYDNLGATNTYLISDFAADGKIAPPMYRGQPYPGGDEREAFNDLIGRFFATLEWNEEGPRVKADAKPLAERFTKPLLDRIKALEAELPDTIEAWEQQQEDKRREADREKQKAILDQYESNKPAEEPSAAELDSMSEDELSALFDEVVNEVAEQSQDQFDSEQSQQPPAAPAPETPLAPDRQAAASMRLSTALEADLSAGEKITAKRLFELADREFGGTQAQGAYTPKDAYDAMEVAVNSTIRVNDAIQLPESAADFATLKTQLEKLMASLPVQSKRTGEQQAFQQFSTPPTHASVMAWVANMDINDVALEPSAGTGSLAVWAHMTGTPVIVNELSPRRAALLRAMDFERVYTENAEQINNILPPDVRPTVVIMNPPFSASGGRLASKDTMIGAQHVEQALLRLANGGRLVALVGRGMAMDRPRFRKWWAKIRSQYHVRANIGIKGEEYRGYGTTFDNQLLVIDKIGPTPADANIQTAADQAVFDLPDLLETIRNERVHPGQSFSDQQGRSALADQGGLGPQRTALIGQPGSAGAETAGVGAGGKALRPGETPGGETGGSAGGPAATAATPGHEETPGRGKRGSSSDSQPSGKTATGGRRPRGSRGAGGATAGMGSPEPGNVDQTVGELINDVAKEGVRGIDEALKGLAELFGGNTLKSFPAGLDPDTYAKAKPHFQASMEAFIAAGKSAKDLLRLLVKNLGAGIKPYFLHYMQERRLEHADKTAPTPPAENNVEPEIQTGQAPAEAQAMGDSIFEQYRPEVTLKGAKPHPGKMVESTAMAAAKAPKVDYLPKLPAGVVEKGLLSDAQLENIIRAGAAHQIINKDPTQGYPNGYRRGYFIGDGTGIGKGRQIAGIILDNWNRGRKKAVWLSEKQPLYKDAQRDMKGAGGDPSVIFPQNGTPPTEAITQKEGVMFTTYSTLRSTANKKKAGEKDFASRLDQIVDWLGKDFDGVIAFDESHNMGNALEQAGSRGKKSASRQALAGVELQRLLPMARVVYVSATGATELSNLAYADRLGLWGPSTPFATKENFINQMAEGGVASMELVAKDMKSMGVYLARSLSYDDVTYGQIEHKLSTEQRDIYNELARAWQIVLQNIGAAIEATGADSNARKNAMSQFWGAHQRFFNQVLTALSMPTVIDSVEADLQKDHSVVLQLVNTNEAATERAVARAEEEGTGLEDLDITPRESLMQYVMNGFPTTQYEEYTDDDGNTQMRPVMDSEGNPVQNQQAVEMRDALLARLGSLRVPEGPLETLLNYFGTDTVAEITGRKRRFVRVTENGRDVVKEQKRGKAVNAADVNAFMSGSKRVLVFSNAGGTGRSYHADLTADNQQRRIHYLVQAGWRADQAIQGFGRTHRTNQASAPHYALVTTDIVAQKRFLSSIARRLDQLGALTRGQRQAGSQGIFSADMNLENDYAKSALYNFFVDVNSRGVPGLSMEMLEQQMGLKLRDKDGNFTPSKIPDIPQFLNRLLSLELDMMDRVFGEFFARLERTIQSAIENDTYDAGIETLRGDSVRKVQQKLARTDPDTGATTEYVELELTEPAPVRTFDQMMEETLRVRRPPVHFVRNRHSGRVYAAIETANVTDRVGRVVERYKLIGPSSEQSRPRHEVNEGKYEFLDDDLNQMRALWAAEYEAAPKTATRKVHLITGAVMPIWDRIIGDPRIIRAQTTDTGERLIGRLVREKDLDTTLRALGLNLDRTYTPQEVLEGVRNQGKTFTLSNQWKIRRVRVSGENRIELYGPSMSEGRALAPFGVFEEIVNFRTRYFLPIDDVSTMERVLHNRPVVDVNDAGSVKYSRRQGAQAQTETPAFKHWFGNSMVTEDGKPGGVPLVVYHGTGAALDIFNPEERFEDERIPENVRIPRHVAAFFTNDSDNASQYAITRASIRSFGTDLPKKGQVPNGAAVQPVYLSLQNPLIVDAEGKHWMSIPFEGKKRNRPSVNDLARIALKRGNDGLIVHNVDDTPPGYKKRTATTFVAFDPAQIKSATGNTGAFSIETPDIRYAQTPADSRAATDFAPHATVADLRAEIEGALGKRLARNLFDRDGLSFRIVDTLANVPGKHPADVAGVSVGNKVYLVRQNIPQGGGAGLVAHEIGVHYGLERMVGRDQFGQIMQHVEAMAGRNVPAVRAARLRAASALLDAERVGEGRYLLNGETLDSDALIARAAEEPLLNEETLAYLAETEAGRKMPVVRRMLAAIRRFLRKLGMLKVEDMTVDDLVAMVKASVRAASRWERTVGKGAVLKYAKPGASAKQTPTSIQREQREDEYGQYYVYGDAVDPAGNWKRFQSLPDDAYVVLYHATSQKAAQAILREGYNAEKKAWADTPADYVYMGFAGQGYGLGTYIGPHTGKSPVYVAFRVKKSDIEPDKGSDWKSYLRDRSAKQFAKDVLGADIKSPTATDTLALINQARAHKSKVEPIGTALIETLQFTPTGDVSAPMPQPKNPDIRYSRAANPSADPDEIRDILETDLDRELARIKPENWKAATQDFVSDLNAKARPSWLKFLTRQQIVDVGSDVLPQALDFERISRKMDAEATSHMEHYGEIGQRWAKYASSLTSPEKRRQSALLARIMHDATLAEVDPAKNRPSDPDKHEDYDRLRALWDKLPADLQTLYKDVRDSYARLRADFEQALIERIEASVADERHRRAMIDQLRRHFEQARVKGPYFPLARFGDFYVIAEKEGESKQFMLFETPRQQREHVQALRNLGYAVRHGKKISNLKSEFAASPGMIKDMSDLIDETVGSRKEAESLKDGLFQMYLQSLPELSVRKKFIHRKGTPGFSRDALRAFSFQTAHGAKQLSKLRYGYQLADLIAGMRDAADNSANPEKAADIVRALDDSYQWAMNPNNATWATRATSFGFAWYLGITPAAALVNLTQTWIITYPVMAARYGAGKAGAMLGRASKDYLRSRASKSFRAALEREYSGGMGRMLTELEESGAIDKTMTHSLLGMSEENFASIKLWEQKAMRFIGWGFHQAERMNREVTAIAAYRLMRDQNRSHAEAVQYAYDTIFESHFDYSSQNRAAFMRSNTARVLLLFRQYSQNTTYLLWRNFYKSFTNAPVEVKREARKKLLGILGMTSLTAGALGLPLMSVMFTVANAMAAAFGDPDDPFDAELEFRSWLADMIGQTPASVLAHGPVNQLTGLDMATRTSLNELWMRSPDRELEAKGLAGYYLEQAAGPLAGVVMSVSRGVDLMQEGHVWRGIEASVPKVIKDSMRAMRYGEQGVQNLRGDPIMQEVDPWLLFWQAQGFSPAELSERYEQNNALKRLETRILNRRRRLINAYAMARLQRDGEMQREVMAKIRDFNRDQPRVLITGDTLNRSMQMRQRYSREMEKGLRVQPKLAQQLEQYRYLGS